MSGKSTFLDIGSGFGKPNFHAAMQCFPRESLGVEVVPARVLYCWDQKLHFEDYHKAKMDKDELKVKSKPNGAGASGGRHNGLSHGAGELNDNKDNSKLELEYNSNNQTTGKTSI